MNQILRTVVRASPGVYRLANWLRGHRLHGRDLAIPTTFLGSGYGGWAVPDAVLPKPLLAYSVGVGEDISFDLALAAYPAKSLHLFDPTPVATRFIESCSLPANVSFSPIGLAESDGVIDFSEPLDADGASFSRAHRGKGASVSCEVCTLRSIQKRLGHIKVDLVKMDIEGFEYAVIDDMVAHGPLPDCLLIEFHHNMYGHAAAETKRAVDKLAQSGYRRFWVSDLGREYGFIRDASTLRKGHKTH